VCVCKKQGTMSRRRLFVGWVGFIQVAGTSLFLRADTDRANPAIEVVDQPLSRNNLFRIDALAPNTGEFGDPVRPGAGGTYSLKVYDESSKTWRNMYCAGVGARRIYLPDNAQETRFCGLHATITGCGADNPTTMFGNVKIIMPHINGGLRLLSRSGVWMEYTGQNQTDPNTYGDAFIFHCNNKFPEFGAYNPTPETGLPVCQPMADLEQAEEVCGTRDMIPYQNTYCYDFDPLKSPFEELILPNCQDRWADSTHCDDILLAYALAATEGTLPEETEEAVQLAVDEYCAENKSTCDAICRLPAQGRGLRFWYCEEAPPVCLEDDECPDGEVCASGVCVPERQGCEEDSDCPADAPYCTPTGCVGCRGTARDCPAGYICDQDRLECIKASGDGNKEEPTSLLALWISLGVLGVLVLGALAYYFFVYRKKKNGKVQGANKGAAEIPLVP
jgi:hypothetical protein